MERCIDKQPISGFSESSGCRFRALRQTHPLFQQPPRLNLSSIRPTTQRDTRTSRPAYLGKGIQKDAVQATALYRKAADAGEPAAMAKLGYLYAHGLGVKQDIQSR